MTDYLELLLRQEEEPEEQAVNWEKALFPETEGEKSRKADLSTVWDSLEYVETAETVRRHQSGQAGQERNTPKAKADLNQEKQTGAAAYGVQENGAWSGGGLLRAWRQVDALGRRISGLQRRQGAAQNRFAPEERTERGSLTAETLDRLVERDARRYDNGFWLL